VPGICRDQYGYTSITLKTNGERKNCKSWDESIEQGPVNYCTAKKNSISSILILTNGPIYLINTVFPAVSDWKLAEVRDRTSAEASVRQNARMVASVNFMVSFVFLR